jgi:DNA-binding beta-propeller fold protein YncE
MRPEEDHGLRNDGNQAGSAHPERGSGLTVPAGGNPQNSALDAATQTLYVTNGADGTVSVIDAATCNANVTAGCRRTPPAVHVGSLPVGIAVDQATDTVYVVNVNSNSVSVINGATCNAQNTSGCSHAPPAVTVGSVPVALDVNQVTDTVYVANWGNGAGTTISVINGRTCNGQHTSGCGQTPASVTVGTAPAGIAVDQPTDTIYAGTVAPSGAEAVSVINGATCNATTVSGCGQTPPSVTVGTGSIDFNVGFAIDQATKTLYVANWTDNTLSMIDKASCNATVTSGCGQTAPTVRVGSGPTGIALDAATHTVYVSNINDNTVSALDAATCNATIASGCRKVPAGSLRTGRAPQGVTADQATSTLYVPNGDDNTVSVLDSATCNATRHFGCTRFPPTVPAGGFPGGVAVNDKTRTVYVANLGDGTVSVIDGATCNAQVTSGCGHSAATVTVGSFPGLLAVDQATDTIYVPNTGDNTVSVIDGATCNATVTSGCGLTPPVITVAGGPGSVAVDEATDSVYAATSAGTVAVIDGATCNAAVTAGCGQTPATVTVGGFLGDVAVDQRTSTVYTANFGDASGPLGSTVSVIDGRTCNAAITTGCGHTPPTVTVGAGPSSLAVDQRTSTVYVTNYGVSGPGFGPGAGHTVSMINGATCNATRTSGCGQNPPTVTTGNGPGDVAIDQAADIIYVVNTGDYSVTVINGAACNATITSGCPRTPPAIQVGGFPLGVAVSQATHTAYITNGNDNNVSIIRAPRHDSRR